MIFWISKSHSFISESKSPFVFLIYIEPTKMYLKKQTKIFVSFCPEFHTYSYHSLFQKHGFSYKVYVNQ